MPTAYEKRVAERDAAREERRAIAKAAIEIARKDGWSDDQIVSFLVEKNLVGPEMLEPESIEDLIATAFTKGRAAFGDGVGGEQPNEADIADGDLSAAIVKAFQRR